MIPFVPIPGTNVLWKLALFRLGRDAMAHLFYIMQQPGRAGVCPCSQMGSCFCCESDRRRMKGAKDNI